MSVRTTSIRLALTLCLAGTVAPLAHAEAAPLLQAPGFRVEPGPPALPVREGLAVVPGQHGRVWFVVGTFWTEHRGRWFTAERRGEAWRPMARLDLPPVLQERSPEDDRLAVQALDRAGRFAHWDEQHRVRHLRTDHPVKHRQPVIVEDDAQEWSRQRALRHRALRQDVAQTRQVHVPTRGR
jgi:hypothetical protein